MLYLCLRAGEVNMNAAFNADWFNYVHLVIYERYSKNFYKQEMFLCMAIIIDTYCWISDISEKDIFALNRFYTAGVFLVRLVYSRGS